MELYLRYGPALLRKCERVLGDRQAAEDVVQQLFVDLLRRGRTDVDLAYLYRAATNRSLNQLRDRRRRLALLERDPPPSRTASADSAVLPLDLVRRLVEGLDERGAEIFVYRFLDDMNQDEIAALVGTSRRTVVKRLADIRTRLAELDSAGGSP